MTKSSVLLLLALILTSCVSSPCKSNCYSHAKKEMLDRDGKHYVDCMDYGTTTAANQIDVDTSKVASHIRAAIVDNFLRKRKLLTAECNEKLKKGLITCIETKCAEESFASGSGKSTGPSNLPTKGGF